jgi:photosystem II stability/assembly factor-like uncharacterized protein
MRSDTPDFDRGLEPGLERDLDTQLRLFFRQAARPAVPLALERAIERLPDRRFRDRIGLPGRHLLVRPMKAALVALSVVLAVATAAGLLNLRGGLYSAPGAHGTATRVPLTPVSRNPDIVAMGRFDSNTGWVEINALDPDDTGRTSSYLRWTEDGGKTWSEPRPVPLPLTEIAMGGVQFVDASHGWTSSYGPGPALGGQTQKHTLWRTSDGGLTWQTSVIPFDTVPQSGFFQGSLHFRDPLHGEAFEFRGPPIDSGQAALSTLADWTCERFSTVDGGVTWSAPKAMPCMPGVRFVDNLLGYAYDWFGRPVLYVTLDGGRTWAAGTLPPEAQGSAYQVPMLLERQSNGTLRALAYWVKDDGTSVNAIVESRDGGRTWAIAGTPSADESTTERYGLPFGLPLAARDENHWLTAPMDDGTKTPPWFGSSDGGLTWTQVTYAGLSGDVRDFNFLNASDGWASTKSADTVAYLWATTDGGATWTRILSTP